MRKKGNNSRTGGRGRSIALIYLIVSMVSALCSIFMIAAFIALISNTVTRPAEECAKQCHPYAPDLRYGECFCDRESILPE